MAVVKIVLKFSPVARYYRRRSRRKLSKALRQNLGEMSIWSANRDKSLVSKPPSTWAAQADYISLYGYFIDRSKPIRVLEIGNFYGDSLRTWQQQLHRDSVIAIVDINSKLVRIGGANGTHVRFGAEQNNTLLRAVTEQYGPFDVIIDTGSTTTADLTNCLACLFTTGLGDGGIYVAKGTYCDFWTFYSQLSFVDLIKALVDALYGHYEFATREEDFRGGQAVVMKRVIGA